MTEVTISPVAKNVDGGVTVPFVQHRRDDGGLVGYAIDGSGEQLSFVAQNSTITTGGTAQQLVGADGKRVSLLLTNTSAGDLWINDLGTAGIGDGMPIAAGRTLSLSGDDCPRGGLSVFGATTAQSFYIRTGARL